MACLDMCKIVKRYSKTTAILLGTEIDKRLYLHSLEDQTNDDRVCKLFWDRTVTRNQNGRNGPLEKTIGV